MASPRTGSTRTSRSAAGRARVRALRRTTWRGCASCSTGGGDGGPRRVPRRPALRDGLQRGLRLHAEGLGRRPAGRRHAGRLAYAVHTEVGHHCIGRGSTGASSRSSRRSRTATSSRSSPPRPTVPVRAGTGSASSRAPAPATRSRQWFSKERREEAIDAGKESIAKAMRKQNLPLQRLMSHESMTAVATDLRNWTSRRLRRRR